MSRLVFSLFYLASSVNAVLLKLMHIVGTCYVFEFLNILSLKYKTIQVILNTILYARQRTCFVASTQQKIYFYPNFMCVSFFCSNSFVQSHIGKSFFKRQLCEADCEGYQWILLPFHIPQIMPIAALFNVYSLRKSLKNFVFQNFICKSTFNIL